MFRYSISCCTTLLILLGYAPTVRGQFDLTFTINPTGFTVSQQQKLGVALASAEVLWENAVTGYQPGISLTGISINVQAGSAFAAASPSASTSQGGFLLSTAGNLFVNPAVVDTFFSWDGSGPTPPNTEFQGANFLDDIVAHEMGHVLGIGTQWTANGVYVVTTGQYTGPFGVAAYQGEFDAAATFVPVELAGSSGTQNTHWNQLMRSSSQEGNPSDPWSLDPRTGILDPMGRDSALELMTGALDPDFGEPFLSNTTVQSLRDIGFTVVPEPGTMSLCGSIALLMAWLAPNRFGRR